MSESRERIIPHAKNVAASALAAAAMLVSTTASSAFVFVTPDFGLPGFSGTGLLGSVWTEALNPGCISTAPCGVADRKLANVIKYMDSNTADAAFVATTVDFPKGSANTANSSTTVGEFLGTDAATLSPGDVGSKVLLVRAAGTGNIRTTLLRFDGYYRVDVPGIVPFNIGSDDGANIVIQGIEVALNDGIHAFQTLPEPVLVEFQAPGLYRLQINWFDGEPVDAGIAFGTGPGLSVIGQSLLYVSPIRVPEPGTLALLGLGLAGLGLTRRRKASS